MGNKTRDEDLEVLLAIARARAGRMSPEEREAEHKAQRESWVRGELGMGSDAVEARMRKKLVTPPPKEEWAAIPWDLFDEIVDYFDNRADAEYFTDSPRPHGNQEMHLLAELRDSMKRVTPPR